MTTNTIEHAPDTTGAAFRAIAVAALVIALLALGTSVLSRTNAAGATSPSAGQPAVQPAYVDATTLNPQDLAAARWHDVVNEPVAVLDAHYGTGR